MKTLKLSWVALVLVTFPTLTLASDPSEKILLRSGEMGLFGFLEMVSEKLDLQIDASSLGVPPETSVVLPNTGPLSVESAKALVLSSLYLQGYTWLRDASTDLYRVMRIRDARDQETPMITEEAKLPETDLLVTYVMAINHTPPDYIARILRSFMPANSRIIPDEATRSVFITDSARNIFKLKKIIQQVDTTQTAKQAAEWLTTQSKRAEVTCPEDRVAPQTQQPTVLIALFSLIALVIGFLSRGYVIRRIEGGL